MKLKYYKEQIIDTVTLLKGTHYHLLEMLFTLAFEGEVKEIQDVLTSDKFNYEVDEFYQFDEPVLNQLCELSEHIEKVKTFLEETYPEQRNFFNVPDEA